MKPHNYFSACALCYSLLIQSNLLNSEDAPPPILQAIIQKYGNSYFGSVDSVINNTEMKSILESKAIRYNEDTELTLNILRCRRDHSECFSEISKIISSEIHALENLTPLERQHRMPLEIALNHIVLDKSRYNDIKNREINWKETEKSAEIERAHNYQYALIEQLIKTENPYILPGLSESCEQLVIRENSREALLALKIRGGDPSSNIDVRKSYFSALCTRIIYQHDSSLIINMLDFFRITKDIRWDKDVILKQICDSASLDQIDFYRTLLKDDKNSVYNNDLRKIIDAIQSQNNRHNVTGETK